MFLTKPNGFSKIIAFFAICILLTPTNLIFAAEVSERGDTVNSTVQTKISEEQNSLKLSTQQVDQTNGSQTLDKSPTSDKEDTKIIPTINNNNKQLETETKTRPNVKDGPEDDVPVYRDSSRDVLKNQQFTTETLTGALRYEYPIVVPPGRSTLTPDLRLSYTNSPSENIGIYGYGWSDNIPYIQRINRRGTNNLYNPNPAYSGFFYSALDGELKLTGATSSAYAAKVDGGDMRSYTFISNAWVVTDKFGTTYKFGTAASSRQDDPANTDHVFKWQLDEVRDTNGNYIKYEYYKNAGQIYPYRILYTGNGSTDGAFEVNFLLQQRFDIASSSQPAFSVVSNYRVYEIQTKFDNSWVKKYSLNFATSSSNQRSIISSIVETGKDENNASTTIPATTFTYHSGDPKNFGTITPTFPEPLVTADHRDNGARLADVNGDGLIDELVGRTGTTTTYLNTATGWVASSTWSTPIAFLAVPSNRDTGAQLVDVNGDGLVDVINHPYSAGTNETHINNGNGWATNSTWNTPVNFLFSDEVPNQENGVRMADVNGDGLVDILWARMSGTATTSNAYINNGAGWTQDNSWASPEPFVTYDNRDRGVRIADVNGDGLVDIVFGKKLYCDGNPSSIYLNNGHGWTLDANWHLPDAVGFTVYGGSVPIGDSGTRFFDFNGDGLLDIVYKDQDSVCGNNGAYINNGAGWSRSIAWSNSFPSNFNFVDPVYYQDQGLRVIDLDGDGMEDFVLASGSYGSNYTYNNTAKKADMLSRTTASQGAITDISYKSSANYSDGTNYLNPNLPQNYETVEKIVTNDGLGNFATTTYSYSGGDYYYNGIFDRQPGGFQTVTKTDPAGNSAKTFYHQGNNSDSSNGEISDYFSKIGRPYRVEVADNSTNIYSKSINRWDSATTTNDRQFISLGRSTDLTYDGDGTHKDKAETYSYATSTGNLTQKISYGEVTASNDGSFSDTGTDDFTTNLTYSVSTTTSVAGLASNETVFDHGNSKVRETKHYYDNLALGDVSLGNETKGEAWVTSSSYINSQKTYNSYGLVTTETDPRNKTTTYTYDTHNLYPATSTNPLSQNTAFQYNYSIGKPTQVTDPNGYKFQTTYDTFGRVKEEKIPDNTTPSTLVTKTIYSYVDNTVPHEVYKYDYLNSATSSHNYSYFDGLGRLVQTRAEVEAANTFAIKDVVYNPIGKIQKESLPYFGAGASTTAATTTANLYTSYIYDALQRVKTTANSLGTTTNIYDDWKLTVTDPESKVKSLYKDAYDNLVKVDEINGANTYTTNYEWNGNKNLTKITDALGNIRNFTYDGLGRVLTGEDLHAVGDSTYGIWNYEYDNAGNLASSTDPVGHNIVYTYDDLNRRTIENDTTNAGNEVLYGYDSCAGGIGKLCFATTTALVLSNEWSPNSQLKKEIKNIFGTTYVTNYTYDRQKNPVTIIHPDGTLITYIYNNAGLPEKIFWKEQNGTSKTLVQNLDHSPLKQVTYLLFGNNASTTNMYDASKLYRLSNKTSGKSGTKFQDLTYTYDAVGNITKIVDISNTNSAKTIDYGYDDLYRLTNASTTNAVSGNYLEAYAYNAIGNITSKSDQGTYTYTGDQGKNFANPHAVTSINGSSITYDKAGNLLGTGIATSTWNYKNQLTKQTTTATTTSYFYDHNGERITQKINSIATTTLISNLYETNGTSTKRVYLGEDLIATIVGTEPSPVTTDLTGGGGEGDAIDPPVAIVHYVHDDHLSGSNVVSDVSANVEELTDYYPYGKLKLNTSTTGFKEKKKFTGHEYDADTQLTYAKARYYDGKTARFESQDPAYLSIGNPQTLKDKTGLELEQYLSDPQNLNSYSYVKNNPLKYKDPSGEWYKEFLTGNQSWPDFQNELGQAANQLSQDSAVWNTAISNPITAGAAVGVAGGAAVAAAGTVEAAYGAYKTAQILGPTLTTIANQQNNVQKVANGLQLGEKFGSLGTVIENAAGKIQGFNHDGTFHGLNQIISRGVSPQTLMNTVSNPLARFTGRFDRVGYLTRDAYVVLDKGGQVVTAWTKSEFGQTVQNVLSKIKN